MPDWSYHPIFRPLLSRLEAGQSREFIYRSMGVVSSLPGGRAFIKLLGHMTPGDSLHHTTDGVHYKSAVGVSARLDPKGTGAKTFGSLGISVLEAGPVSLHTEEASDPEIDWRAEKIYFSSKEPMQSLETCRRAVSMFEGPSLVTIDESMTLDQTVVIITEMKDAIKGFILHEHQIEAAEYADVAYLLQQPETLNAVLLRSPYIKGVVIDAPKKEYKHTFTEDDQALSACIEAANEVRAVSDDLTVVVKGAVKEPADAKKLVGAGASLLLLEEGYVFSGPGLPKRINELMLEETPEEENAKGALWGLLFGLAILIGGMIALGFSMTRIILPYDEQFIGMTRAEIEAFNPAVLAFMAHDRMALAGTMISGGILYIQLARHGLSKRLHWTKVAFHTAAITGFLGIFAFIGYGYFDWLHGVFWLVLLPIYLTSFYLTQESHAFPSSSNRTNSRAWKLSNIGQLLFVMMGAMIMVGGIVITFIGMTGVFVATDLGYLCVTPEMLQAVNERLIPVIAHDRAGFGSALISVGLIVLLLALWGFREGAAWVWNTIAIGALPAFTAGIATHFVIGYTTFIHLLPVYLLVVIYLAGLVFSFPFLKMKSNTY
ncbi:dihydroorotate dehydrogenase [Jeotgalibacillus malaysiensis]|uniref:dihydroorotate dehydrogenase n=1 Tax=Jeotgalibacillus malaysiensis TaxID=1508404 RepID=UPI00384D37AC